MLVRVQYKMIGHLCINLSDQNMTAAPCSRVENGQDTKH